MADVLILGHHLSPVLFTGSLVPGHGVAGNRMRPGKRGKVWRKERKKQGTRREKRLQLFDLGLPWKATAVMRLVRNLFHTTKKGVGEALARPARTSSTHKCWLVSQELAQPACEPLLVRSQDNIPPLVPNISP